MSIYDKITGTKGNIMTAIYTWDVFSTLDGYGSYGPGGDWGGYWGQHGPELLEHRAALFDSEQRMVFGATTFRENAEYMVAGDDPFHSARMERPDDANAGNSDLLDALRGHAGLAGRDDRAGRRRGHRYPAQGGIGRAAALPGSLSLNRALMAAGLVSRLQVTIFPVISGGPEPIRSSRVRPTSTSSCSRAGPSTETPRSSSTRPTLH